MINADQSDLPDGSDYAYDYTYELRFYDDTKLTSQELRYASKMIVFTVSLYTRRNFIDE